MTEWLVNKERNVEIKRLRSLGFSVRQIAKELRCSKAIVSYYCRGTNKLSNKQGGDGTAIKAKWSKLIESVRHSAVVEFADLKVQPWFIGFLGIYWGEGRKSSGQTRQVGVKNNDHELIRVVYESIARLTTKPIVATITYYPLHNRIECDQFWAKLLPTVRLNFRDNTDNRSKQHWCERCLYGACDLRVSDYKLFWRIMTWIECWKHGDLV